MQEQDDKENNQTKKNSNNIKGEGSEIVVLTSPSVDTLSRRPSSTMLGYPTSNGSKSSSSSSSTHSRSSSILKDKDVFVAEASVVGSDPADGNDEATMFLSPTGPSNTVAGYVAQQVHDMTENSTSSISQEAPSSTASASTTGTTTGSSRSSSVVFQNGKTFWMKFLDQPSSSSSGRMSSRSNQDDGNKYNNNYSPMGRMIQRTFTSGSPLSDASVYDTQEIDEGDPDDEVEKTFTNTSSIKKDNGPSEVFQARKQSNDSDSLSKKNNALSPEDMLLSPVQAARLRFEQQSQQSIEKQALVRGGPSLPMKNYAPTTKSNKTSSVTQSTTGRGIPSIIREARSSLKLSTTTFSLDDVADGTNIAAPLRSPDAMIEIGGPFPPTPAATSMSSPMVTTAVDWDDMEPIIEPLVSPPAKSSNSQPHDDRFQDAYRAWQRVGLMPRKTRKSGSFGAAKESSTSVGQTAAIITTTPKWATANLKKTPQTAPPKTTVQVQPSLVSHDKENSARDVHQPEVVLMTPSPTPKASSDDGSDQEFRNILSAWRNKSNDRPNSHFLSPESKQQNSVVRRPSTTSKLPTSTNNSQRSFHGSSISMAQKIQAFEKDTFDRIREQLLADDNQDTHQETTQTSLARAPSTHFVDSDVFEESFVESSNESNRALVILENNDTIQFTVSDCKPNETRIIRNVELVPVTSNSQEYHLNDYTQCECSGSIFSGNDELIAFFLPQMGMACSCGKKQPRAFVNPDDPTSLENVLRPWQVEFLRSFGIYRGEQLVKARHRSAGILASALRQWRRKQGMVPFKTSSCGMAIDVWAKTCKVYVRSIRKQMDAGQELLERRSDDVMKELRNFVGDLPAAPKRRREIASFLIEPESEMEV